MDEGKIFRKGGIYTNVLLTVVVVFFGLLLVFQNCNGKKEVAQTIVRMTDVKDGFVLNDLPNVERRDKFRKMMIRVMEAYSYAYRQQYQKCIKPGELADYIDMCYDLAYALKMPVYMVPVIHLLESSFNPYEFNETSGLNERGIGQQVWSTALYAEKLAGFMPDPLRKLVEVHLKSPEDLFDWRNSTKITFILLWWNRRDFQDREEWYVSVYHWGGFLSRRWDKGNGEIPSRFFINGIQYTVIDYYYSVRKLLSAFERGDLEAGKPVVEEWENNKKKLMKEEIQFYQAKSLIRNLRRELKERRMMEDQLQAKYRELDQIVDETSVKLYNIYSDASKERDGEKIRRRLQDLKLEIKKLVKKLSGEKE